MVQPLGRVVLLVGSLPNKGLWLDAASYSSPMTSTQKAYIQVCNWISAHTSSDFIVQDRVPGNFKHICLLFVDEHFLASVSPEFFFSPILHTTQDHHLRVGRTDLCDSSLYWCVVRLGKKSIFFPTKSWYLFVASTDCFDCCWEHRPSQWWSPETDRRERDRWAIPSKMSAASQSWKGVWVMSLTSQGGCIGMQAPTSWGCWE